MSDDKYHNGNKSNSTLPITVGETRPIIKHIPRSRSISFFRNTNTNTNNTSKKNDKALSSADLQYHSFIAEERRKFISQDSLVKATRSDPIDCLQQIRVNIATEISSLLFQRMEMEKYGIDTSQISMRRIGALETLAELELKLSEKVSVNLKGERMQKIFSLWIDIMRNVAQEVLPPESIDLFFNRFATAMEGWEEKASDLLR